MSKIDKASGAVTANRVRSSMSMLFAWSLREGLALANPVIGTSKRQEHTRDRVLSDDELRSIWRVTNGYDYGTIIKLLILTAQRRAEIGDLQWPEVDLARGLITLPGTRTKNGRQHIIPLAKTALGFLAGRPRGDGAVFYCQSWQYWKGAVDARSGVKDWTIHDLRRTAVTGMANIGIQPHIIEAIVNHVSGHKGGVAGIYNRATYAIEKAAALELWDKHLLSIVGA